MIQTINLLPWREAVRRRHQKRFFVLFGGTVFCVLAILWGVWSYISFQSEVQSSRNQTLKKEILVLDRQLSFLPKLDEQRRAINERLSIITKIQDARNRPTELLSLLSAMIPAGVYLDQLRLQGTKIHLDGVGDSNGRLAAFLSNAEKSMWTKDVAMHLIVSMKGKNSEDLTKFQSSFLMKPVTFDLKTTQIPINIEGKNETSSME